MRRIVNRNTVVIAASQQFLCISFWTVLFILAVDMRGTYIIAIPIKQQITSIFYILCISFKHLKHNVASDLLVQEVAK